MEPKILRPTRKTLEVKGSLYYDEYNRAWSMIRLRKAIIEEYMELKERRASFSYKAVLYQSYEDLEKAIKGMKKEDMPLPIFLFLVKEKEINS